MIHPFLSFPSKIRRFFTCFLSFPLFLVYAHSTKKSIPSEKFYNSTVLFTKESYTLFIKNCSFYTKMAESEKIPPKCYFLEKREIICFLQVLRFADFVPKIVAVASYIVPDLHDTVLGMFHLTSSVHVDIHAYPDFLQFQSDILQCWSSGRKFVQSL